jgi:hypothetical protein
VYDWATGDFTGDGQIDEADLAYLADNWKQPVPTTAVPDPATLLLISSGACALVTRRRK